MRQNYEKHLEEMNEKIEKQEKEKDEEIFRVKKEYNQNKCELDQRKK